MTLDELVQHVASNISLIVIDNDLETGKADFYVEIPETNWIKDSVYDHHVLQIVPLDETRLLVHTKNK